MIETQPPRQRRHRDANVIRDQLDLSTWLMLGAVAQVFIALLPLSRSAAFAPTLLLGLYKSLKLITAISSYRPGNKGEILHKITADYHEDVKSDGGICIFLLGFKSHHPLGLFAPRARETGDFLAKMQVDLQEHAHEFGYLGGQSWINASDSTSGNELMGTYYFRNADGVHKFAHSKIHREAWDWWNRNINKAQHLGIMHEIYECPAGHWENVYVNYKPTGPMATSFAATDEDGKMIWASPQADAMSGRLRTHLGRMGRSTGADNEMLIAETE